MDAIKKTYKIHAPVKEVWKALTVPEYIEKWSGSGAKMDDREGSHFELWGGDINGTNLEVIPEQKLVQEWYSTDSPSPTHLTFELHAEKDGNTRLELIHENVTTSAFDAVSKGWDEYYLGPLKEFLEF